jgi:hypothetical protein
MIKRLLLLLVAANASLLAGCSSGTPTPPPPGPVDPKCQLQSTTEKFPGYPFKVSAFGTDVLPILQASCGTAGCHAAPAGQGAFTVWSATDPATCDFAQSFNAVAKIVDTTTPANSRLTAHITGTQTPSHFTFSDGDPKLAILLKYASDAAAQILADGGGATPVGPASPFDQAVFKSTIAPMFDTCVSAGCHADPGQRGFTLKLATSVATDNANFTAITQRTTLSNPMVSQIYVQATTIHGSGSSRQVKPAEATALLAWITAASVIKPTGPASTCAPISKFNLGTFTSEILPILKGEVDLNNGNQPSGRPACTNGQCHGMERGPGTLHMTGIDPATDLASFACFVDLTAPSRSEVLACPTDTAGCRKQPHPGSNIFIDGTDLNYQKILGFLFGANAGVSPFDFAFYVRNIEPLFNDIQSVEAGTRGITCAETTACHGSQSGQSPPNGSDFPIIPNANNLDALTRNFVAASQFTNFLDATESSLFLYPTNEVQNLDAHKFATGRAHPGGLDFDIASQQALLILQWAAGLRPDGNGFNHNWLVAGNFTENNVDNVHIEDKLAPSIFDTHAGTFSSTLGGWDGFFPVGADVDLNVPFPVSGVDRLAYAVAYVLNTRSTELSIKITVSSINQVQILVDGEVRGEKGAGAGTAIANSIILKPAGAAGASTRITIKLVQLAAEPTATFTALFTDQLNNIPLTDRTGELVFTLGKQGGL